MTTVESMRRPTNGYLRVLTDAGITDPDGQEFVLTLAGLVHLLGQDPDLQAMARVNDLEHFVEGCQSPMFAQKLGQAMLTFRESTAA